VPIVAVVAVVVVGIRRYVEQILQIEGETVEEKGPLDIVLAGTAAVEIAVGSPL